MEDQGRGMGRTERTERARGAAKGGEGKQKVREVCNPKAAAAGLSGHIRRYHSPLTVLRDIDLPHERELLPLLHSYQALLVEVSMLNLEISTLSPSLASTPARTCTGWREEEERHRGSSDSERGLWPSALILRHSPRAREARCHDEEQEDEVLKPLRKLMRKILTEASWKRERNGYVRNGIVG
jgi:hypothetical protein